MSQKVAISQDFLKTNRILNVLLDNTLPTVEDEIGINNDTIVLYKNSTVLEMLNNSSIEPFNASDDFTTNPNNLSTRQSIRQYVQQLSAGYDPKDSCNAASTANVTVANPGTDIFDGVTLTNGDRLLLKDQSNAVENGIYIFNGAGSALTRSTDFDNEVDVTQGAFSFVINGTLSGGLSYIVISEGTGTDGHIIGTDAINWTQLSGPANLVGGDGINVTGNTIDVDLQTSRGLEFSSNQLAVNNNDLAGNGLVAGAGVSLDLGGTLNENVEFTLDGLGNTRVFRILASGNSNTETATLQLGSSSSTASINLSARDLNNGNFPSGISIQGDLIGLTLTDRTIPATPLNFKIILNSRNQTFEITNEITGTGISYASDYSATFVGNSLINKIYADSNINGKSTSTIDGLNGGSGPGLTEDGYGLVWDNTSGEYILAAADGISAGDGININSNEISINYNEVVSAIIDESNNLTSETGANNDYIDIDIDSLAGNIINGSTYLIETTGASNNIIDLNLDSVGGALINSSTYLTYQTEELDINFNTLVSDLIANTTYIIDANDGLDIDINELATDLAGNGLTANGSQLDIDTVFLAGNGLTENSGEIQLGGTLNTNTTITAETSNVQTFIIEHTGLSRFGSNDTNTNTANDAGDYSFMQVSGSGMLIRANRAGGISQSEISNTSSIPLSLGVNYDTQNTATEQKINFTSSGISIVDTINSKGLEYAADYSTNFTNNSLVNKIYVDSLLGGGGNLNSFKTTIDNTQLTTDPILDGVNNINNFDYEITHNLNTLDIIVEVREITVGGNEIIIVDNIANTVDTVQIQFNTQIQGNGVDFRVLILET